MDQALRSEQMPAVCGYHTFLCAAKEWFGCFKKPSKVLAKAGFNMNLWKCDFTELGGKVPSRLKHPQEDPIRSHLE